MANPWFKFYGGEFLGDEKMVSLDGNERSIWLTILCLASQKNGVIQFISEMQIIEMAKAKPKGRYAGVLEKFQNYEMVKVSNGNVTVTNWSKRQYSEGYERVKKFRETEMKRSGNGKVRRDIDTDKDIDTKKAEAFGFNKKLFEDFKEITGYNPGDSDLDRQRYPRLIRLKCQKEQLDVSKVIRWAWNFGWKEKGEMIYPWRRNLTLRKMHHDIIPRYLKAKVENEGQKNLAEMKIGFVKALEKTA